MRGFVRKSDANHHHLSSRAGGKGEGVVGETLHVLLAQWLGWENHGNGTIETRNEDLRNYTTFEPIPVINTRQTVTIHRYTVDDVMVMIL